MKEKTRIVIVDDHPVIQDYIKNRVVDRADLELVASGRQGSDVIKLTQEHQPDILILDLHMPQVKEDDDHYFQAAPTIYKISEEYPDTKIIIFSSYLVPALAQEIIRRRVRGYLLKQDNLSLKLIEAIETVMEGGIYISETISKQLGSSSVPQQEIDLSPRQIESLQRVLDLPDLSYAQHAAGMGVSTSTFKSHLSASYRTLGVSNITAALVHCIQMGILNVNSKSQVERKR